MKTKLFNTLFAAVVAGAVTLAGSTVVYAAPLPQDQSMQKPSAGVEIAQDQDTAPVQAPPQDQAAPPQPPEQAPPAGQAAPQDQNQAPPPDESNGGYAGRRQYSQLSGEQLHQLVAPIALYPDALVAQILAAAAYPTQIVEAHRFLQQNPDLKGQALGDAVDQQDWDPSVKALCQFPSVVANMDRDLSWTQELGDANYNQSADVMAAIQLLRHKAYDAGNLRTTPQERVSEQGPDVDIQPADPDVVYVPTYNPAYVYGYPVGLWPGFYPWWGVGFGGPFVSFGFGFPIAPFFGFGWGWHGWGIGWGFDGGIFFGGHPYAWRGAGFYKHAALADAVMLRAQQEAFRAAEATGPTAAMPQTGAMQELTEAMKAGRQQAHAQSLPTAGRREDTPPVETLGGGPTHTAAAMPAVGVGIAAEAIDDSDAI